MKTLKLSSENLKSFEGEELPLNLRQAFLRLMGATKLEGEEAIRAYKVGMDFLKEQESYDLEDADFTLVKKAVEQNAPQYTVLVLGPMLTALKAAETVLLDGKA